jgi:acetolactate synthase I/II/III large subunit
LNLEGVALATGAAYLRIADNAAIADAIRSANETSRTGRPVIVDVRIDYAKRTAFTEGAVKTNFRRFSLGQKARVLTRAVTRRITG